MDDLGAIESRLGEISRERDALNEEAARLIEYRRTLEAISQPEPITPAATVIEPKPIKSEQAFGTL